ncbi:MAG: hypothetical protein ACLGHT_03950 [Acidimicrobiia bacterium]
MPDPLYVRARAALLDAVEALGAHLDAIVLVGAQAIYLHTGDADLAVAEYTTDADFTLSPGELADTPLLGDLLDAAGFISREHPGGWLSRDGIYVDIMVPETLAGPGTRAARLGPHGKRAARRAKGLEGALVDRERRTIQALDPSDGREVSMWVAGPGALLVAKIHKIAERVDHNDRVRDKDALDVLRLLRATDTEHLSRRLSALGTHDLAASVTTEALDALPRLFGTDQSDGVLMALRAAGMTEDPATIAGSLTALVADLRASVG